MRLIPFTALLLSISLSVSAFAQETPRLFLAATGSSLNATSDLANGSADIEGTLYGGEGLVAWRSFTLRLGYSQGNMGIGATRPTTGNNDPSSGGVVGGLLDRILGPGGGTDPFGDLQMVEGSALLGWNVFSGLEISGGLQGRARSVDEESERLLLWLVRARLESPLVSDRIRAYVDGWHSVGGSVTAPQSSAKGFGASAGMIAEFGPVAARMSYGIDEARYGDGVRREVVQGLILGLGYVIR